MMPHLYSALPSWLTVDIQPTESSVFIVLLVGYVMSREGFYV